MKLDRLAALLLLATLGACAQDDPENIPLRGKWVHTITLDSITIDGTAFAASDLGPAMKKLDGATERCGEPLYTRPAWQVDDVASQTGGQCEIEDYSHGEFEARFGGRCELENMGTRFTPRMRGRSTFDETSSRDVITMEGDIRLQGDPNPHVLKIIVVQEGERVGDC